MEAAVQRGTSKHKRAHVANRSVLDTPVEGVSAWPRRREPTAAVYASYVQDDPTPLSA
jgi:hypothetical protein